MTPQDVIKGLGAVRAVVLAARAQLINPEHLDMQGYLVDVVDAAIARLRILPPADDGLAQAHEDLKAILRALGLFDGARPISAHECVVQHVLPAIERLTEQKQIAAHGSGREPR